MSTLQKVESKEIKMTSFGGHTTMSYEKLPAKNIIPDIPVSVTTDPIDPKRISKEPINSLTRSSLVKAGLVFLGTLGTYYLVKTTKILSYFGWGAKNSKDLTNSEIMKVRNREKALTVKTNPEIARRANTPSLNRIEQIYKDDKTIKFEKIKVEEFKDLLGVEKERTRMRRSISIQNPIPNQTTAIGKLFNLTIDGTNVFSSSSDLFLEATTIPTWLTSSNPNPTFKGSYDTPGRAWGVTFSENYAYVADGGSGLQIIDVSNPSNPTFKGSYSTPTSVVSVVLSKDCIFGNCAYMAVAPGLQILDVSDPSNPIYRGSYMTPGSSKEITIFGDYTYIADDTRGLQIVDVSDPSNPTFKGSYDTPSYARGVTVSGDYAYVADSVSGLQIIDISDPSNPTFKGSYDTPDIARKVALSGNYAYVADYESGLQIIDVSDPSNPTFKGSYDTPNYAHGVVVSGDYAYVADSVSGLQIIDVSDPSNPTFKASYNTPGNAGEVALSGNYAYVADYESGLQIIATNLDKLTLSGTPSSVGTYSIDIKACNEALECVTDSFGITVNTVENSSSAALTTTLIIIGSIVVLI
jgi:hypothetical protein